MSVQTVPRHKAATTTIIDPQIDELFTLRNPVDALASYAVGTVVLGRVLDVDCSAAVVELYPGMRTGMSAREVTGNPGGRVSSLMSVDEVLPVRVTARGGHTGRGWRLSMFDLQDSEQILVAPGLLRDGPPCLVQATVAAG